jgi:hypothetical protein
VSDEGCSFFSMGVTTLSPFLMLDSLWSNSSSLLLLALSDLFSSYVIASLLLAFSSNNGLLALIVFS